MRLEPSVWVFGDLYLEPRRLKRLLYHLQSIAPFPIRFAKHCRLLSDHHVASHVAIACSAHARKSEHGPIPKLVSQLARAGRIIKHEKRYRYISVCRQFRHRARQLISPNGDQDGVVIIVRKMPLDSVTATNKRVPVEGFSSPSPWRRM
jgi:hypothetical protein